MSRIDGIRRLFRIPGTRTGIERAVEDELEFHFDMTVRDLMANGMSPEDARREAQRRFGDVERARERIAAIDRSRAGQERRAEWWSAFAQDFRYALRGLRLKPGFSFAVIVDARPRTRRECNDVRHRRSFAVSSAELLIAPERSRAALHRSNERRKGAARQLHRLSTLSRFSRANAIVRRDDAVVLEYLAVGLGAATREMSVGVSGSDLWTMFDVKPVIGRFFTAQEDVPPEGTPVVVISYAFWQTEFGGRADALGSRIDIGPTKYTVIGVAPESFTGFSSEPLAAFIPITAGAATSAAGSSRGTRRTP